MKDKKNYKKMAAKPPRRRSIVATAAAVTASLVVAAIGGGILFVLYFSRNLPTVEQIKNREISQSTKIYDRTGTILLYEISNGEKRTVVPFEEIPQFLKDATIAVEDERFYEEPAFDWKGIARALWVNLKHGRVLQGGSTITQQLARNAFLSTEQTLRRKIKELILAVQLGRHYTKNQIIELYLNEIPYGSTLYGVEAASQAYFGKLTKDVSLAEAAVLAAIPKAPSYYSPWGSHHKELFARQQFVLNKMRELGKISKRDLDEALKKKVVFIPQTTGIRAPHFVLAVQDLLVQKYGEDLIRAGGLRVITTLDWKLQELAEKAVVEGSKRNEELYGGKNAALVAQDPKNGQVLALIGSRDYFDIENDGNFNVATQGLRQPGSALKPFVYLAAFTKGYTPETVLFDVSTNFDTTGNPDKEYKPENFDGAYRGPVRLRQALAQSINIPAVKTLYLSGLQDTLRILQKFGIGTLNDYNRYGLSLTLGGGEVKLAELVNAYGVLSQEGIKHRQTIILEVRDSRGTVLESYEDHPERVVDAQYPRLVNDILSDIDARSGLFSASLPLTVVPDYDIAIKTGTSNDYRDAWTIGYTPALVAGVWVGNNDNSPMHRQGSSILAAVPIWHAFMAEALKDRPPEVFNRPDPVSASQKPMLNGEYDMNSQIHSILFYVNPKDPLGPQPVKPEDNLQFENWEQPVLLWARSTIPNFDQTHNQSSTPQTAIESVIIPGARNLRVAIEEPRGGSFVRGAIALRAPIRSDVSITKITVLLNREVVKEFIGNYGTDYTLSWGFTPNKLELQNIIEVRAINQRNQTSADSVIVYQ